MAADCTIFVLCYGDHPELARRCLNSLRQAGLCGPQLRIGTNAICDETRRFLRVLVDHGELLQQNWYDSPENICKYPLMRKMFYDPANPVTTTFAMWFDDDSCLTTESRGWLPELLAEAQRQQWGLAGSPYFWPWAGDQREWVKRQPWYTGRSVDDRPHIRFVQGAWWLASYAFLKQHDYPWPELKHNGGDVMLGELCYQQGVRVGHFRQGVAINADEQLQESQAKRRGTSLSPIGSKLSQEAAVMTLQEAIPMLEQRLQVLKAAAAEFQTLRQALAGTGPLTLYVAVAGQGQQVPVSTDWPVEIREQLVAGLATQAQTAVMTAVEALHQDSSALLEHCKLAVAAAAATPIVT